MPLQKIALDSVLGLNTERNDSSGINSPAWSSMSAWAVENSSSGATSPNTLLDCSNIIISRNKQAAVRTAFVEKWDFTSTYGSDENFFTTGLYAIPNSTTDSLQFAWSNSTDADIGNFQSSVNRQMKSTQYIIGGTYSSTFTGNFGLAVDFAWNSTQFKIKSFNLARYNTSFRNIYVFSSNGVFRTTVPYLQDTTVSTYNKFKRVTLPLVRNLNATLTTTPSDANRWFLSGSQVDIKVLLTDQLTATQLYQGKPSRTLTVTNTSTSTSIQITFSVDNTNIFVNTTGVGTPGSGGVAVYRTISYLPSEAPPTYFYKCYENSLDAGTTVSNVTTFTNIELTLNDTSIKQLQELYTDLNVESAQLSNGAIISAESSAPPTARDVVGYNNYTVYGNVMSPPFATLTMIALPNSDGLDMLQVGSASVAITYIPNSTVAPTNNGVIDGTTGTFSGVSNVVATGNGYNLIIRPQDPGISTTAATAASYSVPWYAIADTLKIVTGTASTYDIQIVPKPGELFDVSKFLPTGIIAVVGSKTTGNVVALFTYQSFTQVPASGWYLFSNCLAYGVPFTDTTWTTTLQASGSYVLYYIPGTSVTALPVYSIGSDAIGYSSQTGFSLLPTYDKYPGRPFNQNFVGSITSVSQQASTPSGTPVLATINFSGIYSSTAGELLEQCVKTLCDTYNTARGAEDPYAVFNDSATAPVGQLRFESIYSGYNRKSAYTTNASYTSGTGYYDQITARVYRTTGSIVVKFAEPIPSGLLSVLANIMQQSVQTVAGITISKFNKPEEIPIGQNLQPLIIGDPLKPIIKLVNQLNQLLIFKQNEGTYRIDIGGASSVLPNVTILSLLDDTAWLLLPESVQVFEGTTIYFSNKGFAAISSAGQVSEISPTIATELLENYATIYNNQETDKVRSWVITQQRLYCCYFPNVNFDSTSVTYVFNFSTGQWTKWSGEINDAVVSAAGQLTLVNNIYLLSEDVTNNDTLNLVPIDFTSKYWSVIRQADFQTPSTTQVEDIIPLTTFTLTQNFNLSQVTISNFNSTNVYGNLYYLLMLWKDRTIWYFSQTSGYIITKLADTDVATSITLQFVDNEGNALPVDEQPTVSTSDTLVASVNTAIYFNKFFIATPRGSTLSHFNEVQLYTQEGEQYSNLYIGFNSTNIQADVVTLVDTITDVVTTTGSFVTLITTVDNVFSPYYVFSQSQYSFRALVPLSAGRGRFIQIALKHDTPNEVFKLNTVVFIYRDLNSTKIKAHAQ
jgi:hypothetical protein